MTNDYDALAEGYAQAVIGRYLPTGGVCNGSVLNRICMADKYDPDKLYVVTAEGVVEYKGDDDE